MSALLKAWRECTIIMLVVLLGTAAYGIHLAETRHQDAVRQANELQAWHNGAVTRELNLIEKLADKTQNLQDWIDNTREFELRMMQDQINLSKQLNAYFDAFGPLPAKTAD